MSFPYTIALTGGIASGKSTVADLFAELGANIVDADIIARQLVSPKTEVLANIINHFGQHLLTDTGELNRSALRAHIFNHPEDKIWLENYLHPLIRQGMKQAIAQTPIGHYAIAVIPLLKETGIPDYAQRVLVIDCSVETQLTRLLKRDGIDEPLARSMISQQAKREDRLAIADDIIDNNDAILDETVLKAKTLWLHNKYQECQSLTI